jgi:hypothetical protein
LPCSGCEPKQTPADAMEPPPETSFPATLCRWVGEIVQSSPEAARLTLLELIVGAVLASGGHVTQAILALTPRLGWQAYHWMLERGRFRLLGLIAAVCRIVRREIGTGRCFAVIDDTLAPRCSAQAPGVAVRFDHAANARRSCCASASSRCLPWCRAGIDRARCPWSPACAAVRATPASSPWPRDCCAPSAPSGLLLDAWYMRGSLIRTALRLGHEVIGQATPPCSRCHRRASPEGAAGSMVSALMTMQSQHCPPRSTPSPAMPAGRPGCAMPCAARASSGASSSAVRVGERLRQGAPAAVDRSDAVRPGYRRGLLQEVEHRAPVPRP